jgi:hypothetical protein
VHTIDGATALAFVRQRDNRPEGDLDRIHRQQRFITAVVAKAEKTTNPATINDVLETATKSLTVDSGLSGLTLLDLADRLRNLKPADIRFATVPVANIAATAELHGNLEDIVALNMTKLKTFFTNLAAERDPNAAAPTAPSTTSSEPAVAPSTVALTVQNGSGVNGAAGRTQTSLKAYGFQVPSVGTVDITDTTHVLYNPADAAAAAEVGRAVPSATLTSDSSLTAGTVELVLGTDFAGVQNPTAASATPTPTVTTSSSAGDGTTSAGNLDAAQTIDGVPCGP